MRSSPDAIRNASAMWHTAWWTVMRPQRRVWSGVRAASRLRIAAWSSGRAKVLTASGGAARASEQALSSGRHEGLPRAPAGHFRPRDEGREARVAPQRVERAGLRERLGHEVPLVDRALEARQ